VERGLLTAIRAEYDLRIVVVDTNGCYPVLDGVVQERFIEASVPAIN
jgi:hypothetical protein